jgi:hypothetical protein
MPLLGATLEELKPPTTRKEIGWEWEEECSHQLAGLVLVCFFSRQAEEDDEDDEAMGVCSVVSRSEFLRATRRLHLMERSEEEDEVRRGRWSSDGVDKEEVGESVDGGGWVDEVGKVETEEEVWGEIDEGDRMGCLETEVLGGRRSGNPLTGVSWTLRHSSQRKRMSSSPLSTSSTSVPRAAPSTNSISPPPIPPPLLRLWFLWWSRQTRW